jgi:hypothetical protein
MHSETKIAYGSRVARQGRGRAFSLNQARSSSSTHASVCGRAAAVPAASTLSSSGAATCGGLRSAGPESPGGSSVDVARPRAAVIARLRERSASRG